MCNAQYVQHIVHPFLYRNTSFRGCKFIEKIKLDEKVLDKMILGEPFCEINYRKAL